MTTITKKPIVSIVSHIDNNDIYHITAKVVDTDIIKKISIKYAIIDSDSKIEITSVFGTQFHECTDKDKLVFEQFDLAISAYLTGISDDCDSRSLAKHMVNKGFSF